MATPSKSQMHSRQDSNAGQTPAPLQALPIPTAPPLPPPETFDFLPSIYALLRRLPLESGLPENSAGAHNDDSTVAQTGASPSQQHIDRVTSGTGKLELHDLGTAANVIRGKIQKARTVVQGMSDIDRTIEEQEEEIRELELRAGKQRAMLKKLGVTADDSMDMR